MGALEKARTSRRGKAVHYPESDGKPMAETDVHWHAMADLAYQLQHRYRDRDDVYVASNNLVYYVEGDPRKRFSPDVYVVFGIVPGPRRVYKVWEEGRPPNVVFEVSSRATWREDLGAKKQRCAQLGVDEYFLFDPERDYLDDALVGHGLVDGRYEPIEPEPDGAVVSPALGLRFQVDGNQLRVYDAATGERLLGAREAMRSVSENEAEIARLRAEIERLRSGAGPSSSGGRC